MEGLEMELEREALGGPALPPEITRVECCVKDGTGTYRLSWKSRSEEASYLVTLYQDDAALGEPAVVSATSYELTHAVQDMHYKIGVAPASNKQAEVKVDVFSDAIVRLSGIRLTGEHTLCADYTLLREDVDHVTIRIADAQQKEKDIKLCPYEQEIDLQRQGLFGLREFRLYIGAVCMSGNTPVYQSFDNLPPMQVDMERPKLQSVCLPDLNSEESICIALTHAGKGIWESARAGVCLYGGGELFYRSEPVKKMGDSYQFVIGKADMAYERDVSLRVFLQTDRLTSWESLPQAMTAEVPECLDTEYLSESKARLKIKKNLNGFYHYRVLADGKACSCVCDKGGDADFVTVGFVPSVQLAYGLGKLTGYYSAQVKLQQSAYYIFGDTFPCICMSDTPKLAEGEDIVIALPEDIAFQGEISGGHFCIQRQSASGGRFALKLDKSVWDFTEGKVRTSLMEEYDKFLLSVEAGGAKAEDLRRVQELIGDYLPQSFEEFAFYNYHFTDNRMDVFPGFVLRAEYSMYQYVGDDAVSVYENGYTGTFCQEALVIERDGKLCLDPFATELSGGGYVPEMKQPEGQGNLSAAGAAGFLDTQFSEMQRECLRLFYPEKFPELSEKGSTEVCCNVSLMAAASRKKLAEAWQSFLDTGISTVDAPVACFRGRAHVTPCVPVWHLGQERRVPVFTVPRDLRTKREGRIKVARKGKRIYCFSRRAKEWIDCLPLYPGDEIEE